VSRPKNSETQAQPGPALGAAAAPDTATDGANRSSHPQKDRLRDRAAQILERCKKLATFSEDAAGIRRTFLSPPMHDCHREITHWLRAAGAEVHIDVVGNLRAFYAGAAPSAPRLLLGSHLDTVPNAGAYDGILGVVLAVALVEELELRRLPFAIEVVGFSEEEGVRFGVPFLGSRALVGRFEKELLEHKDARGISVRSAIESFGLGPAELPRVALAENALAYLEFHIEQGPMLDSLGLPLAAVEAIVAQTRMELVFLGRANHAGTTPMHLRQDALAAAAEWIIAVEQATREITGLVATVGQIGAKPGAVNVIAGEVRVSLDVRHRSDKQCAKAADGFVNLAKEIAGRRGMTVRAAPLLRQKSVAMDPFLIAQIKQALRAVGCEPYGMSSGAGHDAMILAEKIPAAMIFVRSPGGVSHDPAESVEVKDLAKALECGLTLVDQLANCAEFTTNRSGK
jgi:allantoate deiminase